MKREFMEGMGLEKEAIDKIMAEHGKTVESHKTKAAGLQSNVDDLTGQLAKRDKDLKALKKQAEGSEDLQTQLTNLQTKYDTDKKDYEAKIKDAQLSSALKLALNGKVHDTDMVIDRIDKAKIKLDESGNVTEGLDEQIKTLQESKSFLFVPEENPAPEIKGAKPAEGDPGGKGAPTSLGVDFAKMANEKGTNASTENNPWG
ncbi:phage scaffolding protein [Cytobacillus purgationiresistens]|uniref:Chromosome segregation ATPase n=1 Tax=Cytobacillus purgationiresistens TaxID=863449 RepID=A0ABU0AGM5_9BACI|nr:phage scaffolding protein [Cytobacillus purgationiresistens]MDQ0269947.1 chromosome segregation ATPase [Cytobacillus purgationiresistens]